MSNLKEIRSRISSISSTMKITSAMKMVSAAKLKKAQDRMSNIKPYSSGLKASIQNLLPNINHSEIQLTKNFASNDKTLIVAITSNRGLCGGFNANIFKKAKELGVGIFSSVFDIKSLILLEKLGCPAYKIASLESLHFPLIKAVSKTKKPILISTGTLSIK